ncbi:Glutathione-regulated potassium-efflux system protein KefB [uncultured archaeon]|nr:Glutathione-regulated potassium-efflux system protein KefB [uncultured archaeon]
MEVSLGLVTAFFAAALGTQLSYRLRLPSSVGLIIAGLAVGPAFLGVVERTDIVDFLANIGIILLLFHVGLESSVKKFRSKGPLLVGFMGILLPLVLGFCVSRLFGFDFAESFFVGVILTATSVGITVAILRDLRMLSKPFAETIIGAAVVDDVLGLIALSAAQGLGEKRVFDFGALALVTFKDVAFVVAVLLLGTRLLYYLRTYFQRNIQDSAFYLFMISLALFGALWAKDAGLSTIIGSFLAGIIISESQFHRQKDVFIKDIEPLVNLFAPLFFLSIGLMISFTDLRESLVFGILLTVVAVLGKVFGCYFAAKLAGHDKLDSLIVGFGMIPRGEVALIAASIGLSFGVIQPHVFSAVVLMSLLTSIFPPLVFYFLLSPYSAGSAVEFERRKNSVMERFTLKGFFRVR